MSAIAGPNEHLVARSDYEQLQADNAALRQQFADQSNSLLRQYDIVAETQERAINAERERDALRLKVQELKEWKQIVTGAGTDQESVIRLAATEYTKTAVQCWKDANAKLQARLTTLETLVRQIPLVEGKIEYTSGLGWGILRGTYWDTLPDLGKGLTATLLTHRQGMGG